MNNNIFKSCCVKKHPHNRARVTEVTTPHGTFLTPAFMPVGTRAVVNFMKPEELEAAGSQIILGGNTYHMLCAPGMEVIRSLGGMHRFMNWHKPMLTDSGGFQVFSLSHNPKLCKIDDTGAHFKHPNTGAKLHLNAETSITAQKIIGADIIMAFDQCTPDVAEEKIIVKAMERTHRWLLESKELHTKNPYSEYGFKQALFGIIQGGNSQRFREESMKFILSAELDGVAIGGETIGFDMKKTQEILSWVEPSLPEHQVRYSMGVGLCPQDLLDVVASGVDIFDCVAPTRNARHGSLYHGKLVKENNWLRFHSDYDNQRINIRKAEFAKDGNPILEGCECYTCKNFSRGYLHHLFKQNSIAFGNLACIHNVHVMHHVCEEMRKLVMGE